jgi:dUTP pyrophosphatase
MELKVKVLDQKAVLPKRAHNDDAGYDLCAIDDGTVKVITAIGQPGQSQKPKWRFLYIEYPTGLAMEPPVGYHLEIVARSSVSTTDLILANCTAIGDQGYRGEYKLRFRVPAFAQLSVDADTEADASEMFRSAMDTMGVLRYKVGDKMGQMLIRKTETMDIAIVEELSDTIRGEGGFGSTTNK